jgi:2,4-dienoyl-CoA reductase-like NADH-dependent reductase (Old Yellow Enzyme family)
VSLNMLFSPFSIGSMAVQNRIVMPPMATNYATPEGSVTERQVAYYVERARGGVGYITSAPMDTLEPTTRRVWCKAMQISDWKRTASATNGP